MPETILRVEGEVGRPCELTREDLARIDAAEQVTDVGRLDAKRKGAAVTLRGLLSLANASPEARWLTLHATADDFHASVPLEAVRDRGVLIYSLDGGELPLSSGGPVRFYVPDHAACQSADVDECANVKFVDRLELSRERGFDNRPEDEDDHQALHEKQDAPG